MSPPHLIDSVVNEAARLNALRDLRLLDTPPSESFDRLTRLASQLLGAPVSTISLTDGDRQWFKSKVGVDLDEIPREQAPGSYAIQGDGVFVVPDLAADPRFVDSPLAKAGIRFYAGAPLFTRGGHGLGTICVVDTAPRTIAADEARVLQDLAGMVMSQVELQNLIGRVDPTTGASNQHQLFEDLEDLGRAGASATAILVEFMPPARSADIARVLGVSNGEALNQRALALVRRAAGNSGHLYHVGPMQCVAVLGEAAADGGLAFVAATREALRAPIDCDGVPVSAEPSFGLYTFRPDVIAPADVLRHLLTAGVAGREAEARLAHYDEAQGVRSARQFKLLSDFEAALRAADELILVYQPRVALDTGRWLGVEALLRWHHPDLGPVSPAEFVPLVEQTALGRPMTDWVVRTALRQVRAWRDRGLDLSVSINASALNLDEPDFAERLLDAASEVGVEPHHLELEFTESAVARDATRVTEQLGRLRAAGLAIAVDDFGTGYSNLAYLQQLPVTVLKIDQVFVRNLATSARDRTLVRTMIGMAHDLGYRVVAEGIETQDVYDMLHEWGCDEGQGYLMSRPIPAQVVTDRYPAAQRAQ